MRVHFFSAALRFVVVFVSSIALIENATAQGPASVETQETGALVLAKLAAPVYPPLARQAQIGGDVELKLSISQDGTVESVKVISGHPMLTEAASASAQKLQFVCRNCGSARTSYVMTYTFTPGQHLGVCTDASYALMQQGKAELSATGGHITIVAGPMCAILDNVEISRKTRAVKCLYLWKCGLRQIEEK